VSKPVLENMPDTPSLTLGVNRLPSAAGVAGLRRLRRWMREERLHAVVTFFRDGNLWGTLAARSTGVPVISSRRNLGAGYWHNRRELFLLRRLNQWTRVWVANSRAVADYTLAAEGAPADRMRVIPNAVDLDRFSAGSPVPTREDLGLPRGRLVAAVANLRPVKNHALLFRALPDLLVAEPDVRLLLVGEGDEEPRLRALADELGVADRMVWLGSRSDVHHILPHCDAVTLTSRSESSPNALVEAIAAGRPVAAVDTGGVGELLTDPEIHRLAPPDQPQALAAALAEVLAVPADKTREAGRRAAAGLAKTRSVPVVLEDWYALFDEVCGGRLS